MGQAERRCDTEKSKRDLNISGAYKKKTKKPTMTLHMYMTSPQYKSNAIPGIREINNIIHNDNK